MVTLLSLSPSFFPCEQIPNSHDKKKAQSATPILSYAISIPHRACLTLATPHPRQILRAYVAAYLSIFNGHSNYGGAPGLDAIRFRIVEWQV